MSDPKKQPPLNPEGIVDPRAQPKAIPRWRGDLPHIYKDGCTYFVTFCLVDAVPDWLKRRRKIEGTENPTEMAEHYDLDPSVGNRILRKREIASVVESSMLHFQGKRYAVSAWCVMPNHVHAVVTPYSDHLLSQILHSWKSFSAHEINKVLQRKGTVWEPESFDHLVRHERAFEQFVQYTENNPVVAGFCDSPDQWPFSSARYRISGR
jgi:REP element-mobilizing transposase RayT